MLDIKRSPNGDIFLVHNTRIVGRKKFIKEGKYEDQEGAFVCTDPGPGSPYTLEFVTTSGQRFFISRHLCLCFAEEARKRIDWWKELETAEGSYHGEIDGRMLVPHGVGTMTYHDGSKYRGQWKDGLRHGRGIFFNMEYITAQQGIWVNGQWERELTDDDSCPISLDYIQHPVLTRCGHKFDKSSLEAWLQRNNTCPTCRASPVIYSSLSFIDAHPASHWEPTSSTNTT